MAYYFADCLVTVDWLPNNVTVFLPLLVTADSYRQILQV